METLQTLQPALFNLFNIRNSNLELYKNNYKTLLINIYKL